MNGKIIWHVSSNRWNSAITEYALSSLRALALQGFKQVFSPLQNSPAHQRAKKYSIEVQPFEHFNFSNIYQFWKMYHAIQPDIIIVYEGKEHTLAQICKKSTTQLIRFRGRDVHVHGQESRFKTLLSSLRTEVILAPAHIVAQKFNGDPQLLKVVPIGIDSEVFKKVDSMNRLAPEILIFGRLDPVKGHCEFLTLFKLFLQKVSQIPKPILHIAGCEENIKQADIEAQARAIDLPLQHLKFSIGRIAEVDRLLSMASVGVVSSLGSEVICRVAQEFLLCGTPIFTTKVGALSEVQLAESVFLYDYDDIETASDLLLTVYERSLQETEQQKRERSHLAQQKFSFLAMSESLVKILNEDQ